MTWSDRPPPWHDKEGWLPSGCWQLGCPPGSYLEMEMTALQDWCALYLVPAMRGCWTVLDIVVVTVDIVAIWVESTPEYHLFILQLGQISSIFSTPVNTLKFRDNSPWIIVWKFCGLLVIFCHASQSDTPNHQVLHQNISLVPRGFWTDNTKDFWVA